MRGRLSGGTAERPVLGDGSVSTTPPALRMDAVPAVQNIPLHRSTRRLPRRFAPVPRGKARV